MDTSTGTITKVEKGPYVIHSFMSPDTAEMVCSQIIETPSTVIIVDAQLLREQAQAMKAYVGSLGKPINKILISHGHPDHWAGLEEFPDVPAFSLPETAWEIQSFGQAMLESKKPAFGESVTSTVSVPQALTIEREEIDGLELIYHKNTGTESTFSLMVKIPQLKILIAQDTVYNGVYAYFGDRSYVTKEYCFDHWTSILEDLKGEGYEVIFAGHGRPSDPAVFDRMIAYLADAKSVFESASGGEELKSRMQEKYPDYKVPVMLDLSAFMLYTNPYGY